MKNILQFVAYFILGCIIGGIYIFATKDLEPHSNPAMDIVQTEMVLLICDNDCRYQYKTVDGAWYGTDVGDKLIAHNNLVPLEISETCTMYIRKED